MLCMQIFIYVYKQETYMGSGLSLTLHQNNICTTQHAPHQNDMHHTTTQHAPTKHTPQHAPKHAPKQHGPQHAPHNMNTPTTTLRKCNTRARTAYKFHPLSTIKARTTHLHKQPLFCQPHVPTHVSTQSAAHEHLCREPADRGLSSAPHHPSLPPPPPTHARTHTKH